MPLNNSWGVVRSANPLWNIWENDQKLLDLYRSRCFYDSEEMTCASQLANLVLECCDENETFLDAGCGAAYYYLSLLKKGFPAQYFGIDYTQQMIDMAQSEIGEPYLTRNHFRVMAIEDLEWSFDNIICFHVLTNLPHYMYVLERIFRCAKKKVFMRENVVDQGHFETIYHPDPYIDEDKRSMHVYHSKIPLDELRIFARKFGFEMQEHLDWRTQGSPELVCDVWHTWRVIVFERKERVM